MRANLQGRAEPTAGGAAVYLQVGPIPQCHVRSMHGLVHKVEGCMRSPQEVHPKPSPPLPSHHTPITRPFPHCSLSCAAGPFHLNLAPSARPQHHDHHPMPPTRAHSHGNHTPSAPPSPPFTHHTCTPHTHTPIHQYNIHHTHHTCKTTGWAPSHWASWWPPSPPSSPAAPPPLRPTWLPWAKAW